MSYIEQTLLKDETVIFHERPHPIVFAPTLLAFFATLFFFWYGASFLGYGEAIIQGYRIHSIISLVLFSVGVVWFFQGFIRYSFSEYCITDKRIIMKTGFIERDALELFLVKIEGINVSQTVLGRLMDYGTITIIGTGGTQDSYLNIPHPLQFRKIVQQEMEKAMEGLGEKKDELVN